jgi:hypothetical protein
MPGSSWYISTSIIFDAIVLLTRAPSVTDPNLASWGPCKWVRVRERRWMSAFALSDCRMWKKHTIAGHGRREVNGVIARAVSTLFVRGGCNNSEWPAEFVHFKTPCERTVGQLTTSKIAAMAHACLTVITPAPTDVPVSQEEARTCGHVSNHH